MQEAVEGAPGAAWEWRSSALWGLVAALVAVACGWVSGRYLEDALLRDRAGLTQGMLTGIFVGALVGARTRCLAGWILGPILGAGVGKLDLACLEQLLQWDRISVRAALCVPSWGLPAALLLTFSRRRWSTVAFVALAAAGTDALARWICPGPDGWQIGTRPAIAWGDLLVYVPASFMLAFFARWRIDETWAPEVTVGRLGSLRVRPAVCLMGALAAAAGILLLSPDRELPVRDGFMSRDWPGASAPNVTREISFQELDEIVSGEFAAAGYAMISDYKIEEDGFDFLCDEFDPTARVGFVMIDLEETPSKAEMEPEAERRIEKESAEGRTFILLIRFHDYHDACWSVGDRKMRSLDSALGFADVARRLTIWDAPDESLRRSREQLRGIVRPWLKWVRERRR